MPEIKPVERSEHFPGRLGKFQNRHGAAWLEHTVESPATRARSSPDCGIRTRRKPDRSSHRQTAAPAHRPPRNSTFAPEAAALARARTSISGTKSEPTISAPCGASLRNANARSPVPQHRSSTRAFESCRMALNPFRHAPPPHLVDIERKKMIQQVVSGRDAAEHFPDVGGGFIFIARRLRDAFREARAAMPTSFPAARRSFRLRCLRIAHSRRTRSSIVRRQLRRRIELCRCARAAQSAGVRRAFSCPPASRRPIAREQRKATRAAGRRGAVNSHHASCVARRKHSRSPRPVLTRRSFPSPRLRRADICDSA